MAYQAWSHALLESAVCGDVMGSLNPVRWFQVVVTTHEVPYLDADWFPHIHLLGNSKYGRYGAHMELTIGFECRLPAHAYTYFGQI